MLFEVEPVVTDFELDDDLTVRIAQVKVTLPEPTIYLDPDQVTDLINHLEFALKEIQEK